MEEEKKRREEERKLREEEQENEKILRMDKKISGVMLNTSLTDKEAEKDRVRDDIHEINLTDFDEQIEHVEPDINEKEISVSHEYSMDKIRINSAYLEEDEGDDELSEITGIYDDADFAETEEEAIVMPRQ